MLPAARSRPCTAPGTATILPHSTALPSTAPRPPRSSVAAHAATTPAGANPLLLSAVEALFTFPPVFRAAAAGARRKIVERGAEMGLDFAAEIDALRSVDWDEEIAAATDPSVPTPDYYKVPFHAYEAGNLSMEAALEVTVAAKSVHATVMDPEGKTLDPEGDARLRGSYSSKMKTLLAEGGARPVRDVLDVGAATGLSSAALAATFPEAQITGIDLSPQFLAAGRYLQRQREAASGQKERVKLVHGLAEDTGFADASFDLVSICLVCHELPESASRAIFKEACRVLRPGGALAVMEMNPASPIFQKIMRNPIPYTVFKSTEPYLLDYMNMDMHAAMRDAGFEAPKQLENSPRHRTVVAIKPQ